MDAFPYTQGFLWPEVRAPARDLKARVFGLVRFLLLGFRKKTGTYLRIPSHPNTFFCRAGGTQKVLGIQGSNHTGSGTAEGKGPIVASLEPQPGI